MNNRHSSVHIRWKGKILDETITNIIDMEVFEDGRIIILKKDNGDKIIINTDQTKMVHLINKES